MSEKAGLRIIEDKDFMGKPHPEYSSATLEIVDNEIKRLLQVSENQSCSASVLLCYNTVGGLHQAVSQLPAEYLHRQESRMI